MDCSPPGSSIHGNSPGKNTRVGCRALLQEIFPIQGLNPGLLHCKRILYRLSHQGSPRRQEWVADPFSRGSSQPRNWTGFCCIAGGFFTSWATSQSVQSFSHVYSLRPRGLQNARLLCPLPAPGACSNSCPSSWWCQSKHLILCRPLLLLPPIPPSIRVFSNESTLHTRWPKYWSLSISISPSNDRPGLISFRMDWLDLLAVQGTLKSLLQYHSSKASILWHSAFFTVQLSHPYVTTV